MNIEHRTSNFQPRISAGKVRGIIGRGILAVLFIGLAGALALPVPVRGVDLITLNTNGAVPTLTLGAGIDSVLASLTTASNWTAAPFLTCVKDTKSDRTLFGGGISAVMNLSDHAASMARVDCLDGGVSLVGANLQLQVPFDMFNGYVRATPFGFIGGAYKFNSSDDSAIAITGAGWDFKFPKVSPHWSMAFDLEWWSDRDGLQWRFAPLVWKF